MHGTRLCHRSASTAHGMRRILKTFPPVAKYIRQAVDAGIYYKPEDAVDKDQGRRGGRRPPPRRKSPRGTIIDDYPIEYQILTLHPPIPTKPRLPKKYMPKRPKLPTETLAKKYLKRQDLKRQEGEMDVADKEKNSQDYYQRLLGIPNRSSTSTGSTTNMGLKSVQINKAYAVAMKQYEVMRTQDMDEDEALQVVEDLLEQQDKQERKASRKVTNTLVQERKEVKETIQDTTTIETDDTDVTEEDKLTSSVPSILHSKPRTIQGMSVWSQRLAVVPYKQWSVGATTALDHWIARSILELEESTWQELLQGNNVELMSRGRDIIQAREALFPETILNATDEYKDALQEQVEEEDVADSSTTEKSIDDLLASLGAFDDDYSDTFEDESGDDSFDDKVSKLVGELQRWRTKNAEESYKEWGSDDKEEFETWLEHYVSTLTSEADGKVDMDKTREALLSVPPMSKEESDAFWSHVSDEASAAEWLESLSSMDPSELTQGQQRIFDAFGQLPEEFQINKLVELGALEPLLNEYTPESSRIQFLQRHSSKLLQGVDMEHLVSDPSGPIRAQDMGEKWMNDHGVEKDDRFSIKTMPQTRETDQDELFEAYTTHKAGRARYEEAMFQQGKLGLRYNKDKESKKEEA